ncbi:MAG: TerC family protein [Pseudomonadota bacterium]
MQWLLDPSIWVGLFTLVILEIVLGIDNLVFVAILSDKLPRQLRDKARLTGLSLALIMRLALLSVISWIVSLTAPLLSIGTLAISWRDLILILGGFFLLFKATTELHERLESLPQDGDTERTHASFWTVIAQIVALDAVFSLDAIITAVGMVEHLPVMMAAVVIAMTIMILASKPLTRFVNAHPTIVVLCLSFLLMIGLSLVAEGFGLHIPKGYLYAAIGFSIIIEMFNQIARRNFVRNQAHKPMRERTAEAILKLIGHRQSIEEDIEEDIEQSIPAPEEAFHEEERYMISGVLTLAERSIRTIMTPRIEISWIDCNLTTEEVRAKLFETPHNLFPVCRESLDQIVGIMRAKDILFALEENRTLADVATQYPPIIVPERMDVIKLLETLRRAKGTLVLVMDEFGSVQGLLTPVDLLEAIAGEFPDEDETPDIIREEDSWLVKGMADLHLLQQSLGCDNLVSTNNEYASLGGLLLAHSGSFPAVGDIISFDGLQFEIIKVSERRIELVRIRFSRSALENE